MGTASAFIQLWAPFATGIIELLLTGSHLLLVCEGEPNKSLADRGQDQKGPAAFQVG
jgi:hypothetical protein